MWCPTKEDERFELEFVAETDQFNHPGVDFAHVFTKENACDVANVNFRRAMYLLLCKKILPRVPEGESRSKRFCLAQYVYIPDRMEPTVS